MRNKLFNFGYPHFFWVTFIMKKDISPNPLYIGLFGSRGILFESNLFAVLIE